MNRALKMDPEGQRQQEFPEEDEEGTVPSSAPISPRYSGTRRVSFADPVVPGTLVEETETEPEAEDDDDVSVQDLREEVYICGLSLNIFCGVHLTDRKPRKLPNFDFCTSQLKQLRGEILKRGPQNLGIFGHPLVRKFMPPPF